jgi:glycosyltransferase involved in cell wall biosynthesis
MGERAVRILIVNHTALMSGAEATTLELLRGPQDGQEFVWASPEGRVAEHARALGAPHVPLRGTAGSLRLSLRDTPQAIAELAAMGVQVRRAAARQRIDLVHAVSMRAGIVAAASRRLGGPPFLIFQHDVAPGGRVGRAIRALVDPVAGRLVACSEHILHTLRREGYRTAGEVVPEPIDLARFTTSSGDAPAVRESLAPGPGPVIALIAQITPWKGQDTAIRAMAHVRERHPDARLVIVGDVTFASRATRYDNHAYLAGLHELVELLGLGDTVRFAGRRDDMPTLMRAIDILLLPSWEEPFGRVVAEGMAAGVPVIATTVGGPAETITHARDGLLARPRDPQAWAQVIVRLLDDPAEARRIGEAARESATRFAVDRFFPAMRAAHLAAL